MKAPSRVQREERMGERGRPRRLPGPVRPSSFVVIGPPPPLLTRQRLLLALAGAAALMAALLPEAADQPSLAGARFAYIDPGAGSFVFQALVALLAAAGVTVRAYWKNIKAFFDRTTRDERDSDASDTASTDD